MELMKSMFLSILNIPCNLIIDVTNSELCHEYPVYTLAGKIRKHWVDWTKIEKQGQKIKTHFGIFTFIASERIDKVWYWILTDGTDVIKIKRDQARKNKKLPKTTMYLVIVDDTVVEVPQVTYQLCLPAPMELIDRLVIEADVYLTHNNLFNWSDWQNDEEFGVDSIWRDKCCFLGYACDQGWKDNRTVYNQLLQHYHPDRCPDIPTDDFMQLRQVI